jgi:HSP20 family protein
MTLSLNPFEPLARLRREMAELDSALDLPADVTPFIEAPVVAYPAINAWEDGDNAVIEAELPGLGLDDVNVLVGANEVTLSSNGKACQGECKGGTCVRKERKERAFSRTVALPWDIDAAKVSAKLADGVLTVRLPKSERSKPKKVAISGV